MVNRYRHIARVYARRYAMQALYEHQMAGRNLLEIAQDYRADSELCGKMDTAYFFRLLNGVEANKKNIVSQLESVSGYSFDKVDPVEQSVMLYAAYELLYMPEVEIPVVLAEAVKINKKYGSEEGYRLINGALDKLAKNARQGQQTE